MNRELSRNMSSKGFPNKIDDAIGSGEIVDENLWNLGRDKETQQSINWQKPKSTSISESGSGSIHAVVVSEPSSKLVSEISSAPASAGVSQPAAQISETEKMWYYQDPSGKVQGPFSMVQLRKWSNTGYFPTDLKIWKTAEKQDDSILLTDALAGKFQKDPLGACSFTKAQITSHSGMPHGAAVQQGVEGSGGERLKFDQTRAPWNPQGNLVSSSQPMLESWKSQPEMSSSTGSAAPLSLEIFEIPKYSQEPWSSETNLPSPTPNQTTAPTKRRTFESRWSPTPAQPSASLPVASHFPGGGGSQAPAVVSESGQLTHSSTPQSSLKVGGGVNGSSSSHGASPAPNNMLLSPTAPQAHSQPAMTGESQGVQANPHRLPVLDSPGALTNPSGSVPRVEVTALPPTPTSGSQHWGNASSLPAQPPAYGHWVNASSSSQNSASTFSTVNPAVVFPSQSQPGFPPSDSWRLPVPSQSTVQAPVPLPNLPWGVGITDNQSNVPRQGPENQNSGWGPMPGNPNISWGPIPTNTNMNWGPSGPGPSQGNPNSGWVAPIQGQAHGNAN
ncbi:zinc finger CCCH domain-containing protein 19-like, partial [Carica papaya]|uniref:zinc finger CCCH domain-containing protein 19-like n=1 Tax=Carica papaya TaxID=3649 RepID=UPI000B8CA384